MLNETIFREYDIRGVADTDLSDENASLIGKAIGTYFRKNNCKLISLGRDCRLSSPRIFAKLKESLIGCGLDIWDLGLVPTPISYFSVHTMKIDGAVMITASHNPPKYNGFKISLGHLTIYGDEIQKIKEIALGKDFAIGTGQYHEIDLKEKYMQTIMDDIRHPLNIKVVIDSGNGMAGLIAPELLRRLGCEVIDLFSEPDGNFPNHQADPTVLKNMDALIKEVKKQNVLAGIGFDGDADRIGVVDETGRMIYGDELLVVYSREVLSKNPKATIISEVKSSYRLFQDIEKHGGIPIQWKTGHSLIKAKMKETGALLAGEMSGHMFFSDRYYGYDDAIYAAARLLEILSEKRKTPAELISNLPQTVSTPEIRVDCDDHIKFQVVERAKKNLAHLGLKLNVIDGVRVEYPDGWGLVRASNTQAALVFRFEAQTDQRLSEIRQLIESTVHSAKSAIEKL